MFSLSTIVIAVCDVIIVVCFVLLALRYRNLEKRVFSMRVSLNDCARVLAGQEKALFEINCSLPICKREVESVRTDVRKLHEALSFLENSHVALRTVVSDLRSFCDSVITFKEVKPESTKKTTKKTAKNGKK